MKSDVIRIQWMVKNGRTYLDIRRCITTPSGIIATSRGLAIPEGVVDQVLEALRQAGDRPVEIEI